MARVSAAPWLVALGLAAVHVALKAPRLGASSLWLDEAVSAHLAQLDLAGIVQASREDTTPPLYYLLLAGFERLLGVSEAAVRWPSVLASAATASALFLLARRRLGHFSAWLASALFLFSDVNLRYAREARPYTLAALLCVLSFALFLRALERPALRTWAPVAALNAAMLFTHYATAFAVAAQGLALLWPWRGWRALRGFALAHLPVVLVFVAWLVPVLATGQQHKMGWIEPPLLPRLGKILGWYAGGHRGLPGFAALFLGAGVAFARSRWRAVPASLVAPLALWALAPILLSFGTSFAVPSLHARYLLYATPGLILLWSAAARALPAGRLRLLGAGVACAVTAIGFGRSGRCQTADWRGAALLARAHRPDRVLVVPWYEETPFAYYYDPAAFRDPLHTSARLAAEGVRMVGERPDAGLLDLGAARDVVLVARGAPAPAPASDLARQLEGRGFALAERRQLEGLTLTRFVHASVVRQEPER